MHKGQSVGATVAEVLAAHVADDGWCRGCMDQWGRLIRYPCTQAEWAERVRDGGIPDTVPGGEPEAQR